MFILKTKDIDQLKLSKAKKVLHKNLFVWIGEVLLDVLGHTEALDLLLTFIYNIQYI